MISEVDVLDILDNVPNSNLGDLYLRLGLTQTHVTNARLASASTPREGEKNVLFLWRNINDQAATREVILAAMGIAGEWKMWGNILREKWGYPLLV